MQVSFGSSRAISTNNSQILDILRGVDSNNPISRKYRFDKIETTERGLHRGVLTDETEKHVLEGLDDIWYGGESKIEEKSKLLLSIQNLKDYLFEKGKKYPVIDDLKSLKRYFPDLLIKK